MANIDLIVLSLAFIVLLCSLTVHEAAHAWTADRLGDPTARLLGRISLNPAVHADLVGTILFPLVAMSTGVPLIGWAKPVPVDVRRLGHHRRDYMLVAAAGPASNLALALGGALVFQFVRPVESLGEASMPALYLEYFFQQMVRLNVMLAVFNMMPIPPLDGGNVIGGLLPPRLAMRYDAIRPYGIFILYALMFTGTLFTFVSPPARLLVSWLLP